MRGDEGGCWSRRVSLNTRDVVGDNVAVGGPGGDDDAALLSSASAATTAATNMDTEEQTIGRGSDRVVDTWLSANGREEGTLRMKEITRENIIEEYWQGKAGDCKQRTRSRRKDADACPTDPGDVAAMMTSLTIEGLKSSQSVADTRSHVASIVSNARSS
jgi:hypothetical protein